MTKKCKFDVELRTTLTILQKEKYEILLKKQLKI